MFKYIADILSKISQSQRILALTILVIAGVSLVLVPRLLDKKDCSELYKEVESQGQQIMNLNRKIVENDTKYTNEKLQREEEIRKILSVLSDELKELKAKAAYMERESNLVLNTYSGQDTVSLKVKRIPVKARHLNFDPVMHELDCLNKMVDKKPPHNK
jgi:hypothetical protein